VFWRISWLPGGGGLTAPYTRSNRPLWTAGFRGVSVVVGACVVRLLVEFAPRTSSTPVATWCWQTEGRSAERVILGVRPSEFILSEFQSPSRRIFIGSHSLPPLWSPNRSFKGQAQVITTLGGVVHHPRSAPTQDIQDPVRGQEGRLQRMEHRAPAPVLSLSNCSNLVHK
jgi:hypothetical protein